MAIGGELHADEETLLLDDGSHQEDLLGINIYPAANPEQWLEFDSMTNLRPSYDNRSRGVDDHETRTRIAATVYRARATSSHQHGDLAAGRWFELGLVEQSANVGSEVERALELLDLTLADPKNRGRRKEPCRAREVLVDYFAGDDQYGSTDELWRRYFLGFAWAAQMRRMSNRAAESG